MQHVQVWPVQGGLGLMFCFGTASVEWFLPGSGSVGSPLDNPFKNPSHMLFGAVKVLQAYMTCSAFPGLLLNRLNLHTG